MSRVLILGDTHIPDRAHRIPAILSELIEKEYWDYVIFTGDLTSREIQSWIEGLGSEVVLVRGNMDYLPLPLYGKLTIGNFKIGVYHGHGIYPRGDIRGLTKVALDLQVDLLASGHTHLAFIRTDQSGKILLVNPGSATGAWSGELNFGPPSVMVLNVDGSVIHATLISVSNNLLKHDLYVIEKRNRWFIYPGGGNR